MIAVFISEVRLANPELVRLEPRDILSAECEDSVNEAPLESDLKDTPRIGELLVLVEIPVVTLTVEPSPDAVDVSAPPITEEETVDPDERIADPVAILEVDAQVPEVDKSLLDVSKTLSPAKGDKDDKGVKLAVSWLAVDWLAEAPSGLLVVEGLLGTGDISVPEAVPAVVSDVPLPVANSEDPDKAGPVVGNLDDSEANVEDIALAGKEIILDVEAPGAVDTAG